MDSIFKKYVSAFGTMFTDIEIRNWNDTENKWDGFIRVPVSYGPKESHLARLTLREKTDGNEVIAITLPRIAFEMQSITYDPDRTLNKRNFYVSEKDTNGNVKYVQYSGVPYNIDFELYIIVKYAEHGTQIIEQILPFFTPQLNITLNVAGNSNVKVDVPVILNSVATNDSYENSFTFRRAITWTLSFTMKALMFNYPDEDKGRFELPIIKKVITELGTIDDEGNKNLFEKTTTIPFVENKSLDEILSSDDWSTITTWEKI